MRNILIWTLSILLGFEPALWAQGQANKQADIKAFLEKSELGKKPQTFIEMYHKVSVDIPAGEAEKLNAFMVLSQNYKLPKFDIRKMKSSNGKEYYQLQGVKDGQSVTAEIYGEEAQFMRINGQVFTAQDMRAPQNAFAKLGLTQNEAETYFPRGPANEKQMLSWEQIQKLPKSDQKRYFRQLRQLLESMEAVQAIQLQQGQPTSHFEGAPQKFEVIARLLQGESAFAAFAENETCVAGGRLAVVRKDPKKGLSCGSDGNGGVAEEYRKHGIGNELCPQYTFSCNPLIYKGTESICSPAGRVTTKLCNESARKSGEDIPDIAKNLTDLRDFRNDALSEARKVKDFCDTAFNGSEAPARPSKARKAADSSESKKGSSGGSGPNGLVIDQKETCENFNNRYEEILSWDCGNAQFKENKNYKKLCEEQRPAPGSPKPADPVPGQPEPSPAPAPTPGATETPKPSGDKRIRCDQLPVNESTKTDCEGGSVTRKTTGEIRCFDGQAERDIYVCVCDQGPVQSGFRCLKNKDSGTDSDSGKKKKKKNEGPNWLLIGGILGGGLLLFHWLNKRAAKQMYQQLEPTPQNPPLPPPAAPAPRGVQ